MASPIAAPPQAPQAEVNLKENFFRYFQHEVTALQEQMSRLQTISPSGGELTDALDHCLAGIDRLSHEVKDASAYIPAYDQRTYAAAIKALSEKLHGIRNTSSGKKKFSFKTARKNESAVSLADAVELANQSGFNKGGLRAPGAAGRGAGGSTSGGQNSGISSMAGSSFATTPWEKMSPSEEKREVDLEAKNALGSSDAPSNGDSMTTKGKGTSSGLGTGISVSNHIGSHIVLPPPSSSSTDSTRSGTVMNIRHSVVDLSPPTINGGHPFANLTLKNIKDSLIVCGQVAGPTHITGLSHSVMVVSTRQFRMHGSKNVDVYLHCASRPIIEDCENIRFAPIPATYTTNDISATQNQWDQIDDFKWLKAEPSPHFSILPQADWVKEEVWRNTVPGGHSVSLDDILRAVGVLQGVAAVG